MGVLNTTMLISWAGSKVRMKRKILPYIERADRKQYIEPFGGGGGLLFGKPPERSEIYNDVNTLLVNLFRQLRKPETPELFTKLAAVSPKSRVIFSEYKRLALAFYQGDKETFARLKQEGGFESYSDEQIAAFTFFYCQRNGFAGNFLDVYGTEKVRDKPCHESGRDATYRRVVDEIQAFCDRMKFVQVECLPFEEVFKKYDCNTALFYCDPPYDVKCSSVYAQGWGVEKTKELVEICANAKGGVILSCYDSPIYERLLDAGFKRETFQSYMSVCKTKREPRVETLYYRFKEK